MCNVGEILKKKIVLITRRLGQVPLVIFLQNLQFNLIYKFKNPANDAIEL